jgi:thioredoxin 1
MKVEMFYTPGCSECVAAHAKLRTAAQEAVKDLEWRDVSVLDDLDHAVELGVITLPSIVIDGKLVFTSMPTVTQLREALIERNGARA